MLDIVRKIIAYFPSFIENMLIKIEEKIIWWIKSTILPRIIVLCWLAEDCDPAGLYEND
jgi:hypothetical protein